MKTRKKLGYQAIDHHLYRVGKLLDINNLSKFNNRKD